MKARLPGALIAASIAAPALADPPPWAPAHGKRAKDARETWYADRYYRDGRSYKAHRLSHDDRIYRGRDGRYYRSEEHTSELQSLMRISYAVFCLNKKKTYKQ